MTPEEHVRMQDYVDKRFDDLSALLTSQHRALESQLDRRVEHLRREAITAQETAGKAVDKAEGVIDRRLAAMNQFREQLIAQEASFLTRELYNQSHKELITRIDTLESWKDTVTGRTVGIVLVWSLFIAVASGFIVHTLAR